MKGVLGFCSRHSPDKCGELEAGSCRQGHVVTHALQLALTAAEKHMHACRAMITWDRKLGNKCRGTGWRAAVTC